MSFPIPQVLSLLHTLFTQLVLDRAAPTLTRTLEAGQGNGTIRDSTVIVVAAVAKMFVGDVIEEGDGRTKRI